MIPVAPSDFCVATDDESFAYVRDIVEEMMRHSGITREECSRIDELLPHRWSLPS